MTDLDAASGSLVETRRHLTKVLVCCGDYVNRKADVDPEAAELAGLLAAAYDDLAIAGINATTIMEGHTDG